MESTDIAELFQSVMVAHSLIRAIAFSGLKMMQKPVPIRKHNTIIPSEFPLHS